ncbi:MAG: cytochrome c [Actinomycetota bacterium]|nr:cytochrome c [Actinomycetota bacterium]
MGTLAFTLFWVALGLLILFMAMRVGRRHRATTKASKRLPVVYILGFAAATLLTVAVSAYATLALHDDGGIPSANVENLTAEEQHGQSLFGQRCRNCHTLAAANASAKVGPNLDQLRPPKALVLDAIEKGRSRGNGQMAADLVQGEDAEAVAAFVAKATGAKEPE